MNEPEFAGRICRVLDEELEQLPERVTTRLAAARSAALTKAPSLRTNAAPRRTAAAERPATPRTTPRAGGAWLRWLPVPLATMLFAVCLLGVWHWSDLRRAQEIAALDVAILADDVPLAIYADRGFGVYLRNTGR